MAAFLIPRSGCGIGNRSCKHWLDTAVCASAGTVCGPLLMGMGFAYCVPVRRCIRRSRWRLQPASWHFLFSERHYIYCARYRENTGFGLPVPEWAILKWLGLIAPGVDVWIRRSSVRGESAGARQTGLTLGLRAIAQDKKYFFVGIRWQLTRRLR